MKPKTKGRLFLAGILVLCALLVYTAILINQSYDWEDKWKEDVDGVIWDTMGGGLSNRGWLIVDAEDLEIDEDGEYYYPVDVHYDRVYAGGEHAGGTYTRPQTTAYLPGRNWNDYEEGDHFTGRLHPYTPDSGPKMLPLVSFAFCLAIIAPILGYTIKRLKGWE